VNNKKGFNVTIRYTERKRIEEALVLAETLSSSFESAKEGIFYIDSLTGEVNF
jgi:hypothetical protein